MAVYVNPSEEMFTESYLEAFYKAHVASRRGNIDEDIAAIEAEIKKVQRYRCRFLSYRLDTALNSCGSSECSDDEEECVMEASPTSVFRVYNSSVKDSVEAPAQLSPSHSTPDIFSWALLQHVTHDHDYCPSPGSPSPSEQHTPIDHGALAIRNIKWEQLSPPKRLQAICKLSCILQHRPSDSQPFICHSLDFLPTSLASAIRRTNGLGLTGQRSKQRCGVGGRPTKRHCQKLGVHLLHKRTSKTGTGSLSQLQVKRRHTGSSCSEDSDVVID